MKILAVDDDPIILELLKEFLAAFEFTNVRFAESAKEALKLVHSEQVPFDCFMLDIQMPEIDGIQLTGMLRDIPEYARTPILMVTAMSDRKYIDGAFRAGATDYVTKPFEITELNARLRLIETLVQERRQLDDRNPVDLPVSGTVTVSAADLQSPVHIEEVDGVIDYLALENYLLQMSRSSMFGNCIFAVAIKDVTRLFKGASQYEFRCAITDVAEAISECLKPHHFLVAHAGGGILACVRDAGRQFDPAEFSRNLHDKLQEMDLYYYDGRPLVLHLAVGDPIQLDLKSPRSAPSLLVNACANAETAAEQGHTGNPVDPPLFRSILGWGK